MADVLGLVARPLDVGLAGFQRVADAVQAGHEDAVAAELVEHRTPHAGHDAHVDHHVGAVRQFDADVGDRRADGAHREGDDVHGAPAHATLEQSAQRFLHLVRMLPVVVGAGIVGIRGADVGAVFDAGDVGRVGQGEVGILALRRIQLDHGAAGNHLGKQAIGLFLRAVAPDDAFRLRERRNFGDPGTQPGVLDMGRGQNSIGLCHDAKISTLI